MLIGLRPLSIVSQIGAANTGTVVLLNHMDGANGASVFTDETGKIVTVAAYTTDTSTKQFGTSSGKADISGNSYLEYADSADWDFGDGDFTIEGFFRTTITTDQVLAHTWAAVAGNLSWIAYIIGGTVKFFASEDGSAVAVSAEGPAASVSTLTWHHFAIVRKNGSVTVYVDGVGGTPVSSLNAYYDNSVPLQLGRNPAGAFYFRGHLDEFRIIKGFAVYDGNFTPPVTAFPDP